MRTPASGAPWGTEGMSAMVRMLGRVRAPGNGEAGRSAWRKAPAESAHRHGRIHVAMTQPIVYGTSASRALRAIWGIEETGIAYTHVPTGFGADSKTPE